MNTPEIAPIDIKPRTTWRWKQPEYKPVLLPQIEYPTDVSFKWYERIQWKSILENMGMLVVGILKALPKTALIGEALGKLFKTKPTLYDKLLELIQLIINKLKSLRRKS